MQSRKVEVGCNPTYARHRLAAAVGLKKSKPTLIRRAKTRAGKTFDIAKSRFQVHVSPRIICAAIIGSKGYRSRNKEQGNQVKMPSATEEKVAPKIIDPASEHGEEIDASVDRDRIRVVR